MRVKSNINLGIVNSRLNSLNYHYMNCMVDGKENYKFGLGVKGLRLPVHFCGSLGDKQFGMDFDININSLCHFKLWGVTC